MVGFAFLTLDSQVQVCFLTSDSVLRNVSNKLDSHVASHLMSCVKSELECRISNFANLGNRRERIDQNSVVGNCDVVNTSSGTVVHLSEVVQNNERLSDGFCRECTFGSTIVDIHVVLHKFRITSSLHIECRLVA